MPITLALPVAFVLGCLLIHAGRAYARATTLLLSVVAVTLALTVGGLVCERLGLPAGAAEAGELVWPEAGQ